MLKLASLAEPLRAEAVHVVRRRLGALQQGALPGTLDALRLAIAQHGDVASAMLMDIDADCSAATGVQARPMLSSTCRLLGAVLTAISLQDKHCAYHQIDVMAIAFILL